MDCMVNKKLYEVDYWNVWGPNTLLLLLLLLLSLLLFILLVISGHAWCCQAPKVRMGHLTESLLGGCFRRSFNGCTKPGNSVK
jgi:small-conductance mechanosensitive channel